MKLELVLDDIHKMELRKLFRFEFENHVPFEARIKEETVIENLYCNSILYNTARATAMAAFNVVMAGCKAIVESFYSVMGSQAQVGRQDIGGLGFVQCSSFRKCGFSSSKTVC